MPAAGSGVPASIRFWNHVDRRGPDECWLWKGAVARVYGAFTADEKYPNGKMKQVKAHRFSWELANGRSIPDGMVICHRCDVPLCVNPAHLFLGTRQDNVDDQVRKNRHPSRLKGWTPCAKLTLEQVEVIRTLKGVRGGATVANEYGVHMQTVYDIWQGRTWTVDKGTVSA